MRKYPTVKDTAKNPKFILSKAQQNIRSKQKDLYVFVEGEKDSRFLKNIGLVNNRIGFDGFSGKKLVKKLLIDSMNSPYCIFTKCFFIMDIDYDFLVNNKIQKYENVFYHGYCNLNNLFFYNDLEMFLIHTKAFQKLLNEFDIEEDANLLKSNLLSLAFEIGIYRLADELIVKKNMLNTSVLDGIMLEPFINIADFSFLDFEFKESLKLRSPKKDYLFDLFDQVDILKSEIKDINKTVKGHDFTELLEIFLKYNGKKWAKQTNLEMTLRVGCEANEFFNTDLGKSFISRPLINPYL
ncbi:hypothetical protein B9T33_11180 [Acinetobacter sp. ANC 5054]|uniref:hypothetical protein n=1 Tax=Acinetobacter sp. ANC 5054 TaxID=1977877 RepID=UPI000A353092|nr:hypothetical protein [Acinetobacter sp. ANC 5054]OTG79695.1 hypothetical protein B9T33_11180 [Acinetobacter sp. ANC 5054]